MHCLWCDQTMIPEMNWDNLFHLSKPKYICETCESKLETLTGKRCDRCSRLSDETICTDCEWWLIQTEGRDPLEGNYSIFAYNKSMQELIAKWKYRGDYCLGNIFQPIFTDAYNRYFRFLPKDSVAVPIPLSPERISERKFNQAKVLGDFLPLQSVELLTRIDGEKQSKKTRWERLSTKNPFSVAGKVNKSVVLVDDIYTTGTTLRHAAALLKEKGCTNIYAYTLIRG